MALARTLARGRLYYGWYIVATALMATFIATAVDIWVGSLFVKPMTEGLGWSRASFMNVLAFGYGVMSIVTLFVGPILDRRGGRGLMLFGASLSGLALLGLSQVNTLWQFYLLHGVILKIGIATSSFTVANVAVSNWFIKKRGRAIGIAASGIGVSGVLMPPLTALFMDSLGWRWSWALLGFLYWFSIIPWAYLFMKRRPEDLGLLPDGEKAPSSPFKEGAGGTPSTPPREMVWTRRQFLGSATAWLLVLGFGIPCLGRFAMNWNFVPFITDMGFSAATGALLLSVSAFSNVLARPFWGYFTELRDVRYVAIANFLVTALGILLIVATREVWALYVASFIWGVGMSGYVPLNELIWANYYGRLSLGSIRSITWAGTQIFIILGFLFAGYFFELLGGYFWVFLAFGLTYTFSSLLIFFARPPHHPSLAQAPTKA